MKKLLALLLVLTMLFALVACSGQNDAPATEAPTEPSTEAPTEPATETPTEPTVETTDEASPAYVENAVSVPSTTGDYDIPTILTIPEGEGPFPLVVLIHGLSGSKEENIGFTYISRVLAQTGIATIRFDQPGCGESTLDFTNYCYSENINNSNDCLAYALANANIDETKLGILGYSMGGAATNIITSREDNPYAVRVLLAPAYELADLYETAYDNLATAEKDGYVPFMFFGKELHLSAQYYKDVIDYVENREKVLETADLPTLLITGTEDTTVAYEEAVALGKALHADILSLDGVDHGYGFYNGPDGFETMDTIATTVAGFFYTHLTDNNAAAMFGE